DGDAGAGVRGQRVAAAAAAQRRRRGLEPRRRGLDARGRRPVPAGAGADPTRGRPTLLPSPLRRPAHARGLHRPPPRRGRAQRPEQRTGRGRAGDPPAGTREPLAPGGAMTSSGSRALAWTLCAVTVAVAIAFVVVAIIDPNAGGPQHVSPSGPTPHDKAAGGYVPYAVLTAIVFVAFAVVGGVVASRRPRNPVGWCLAIGALLWALGVLSSGVYWHLAFGREHPPAAAEYMAWLGNWTFAPA